MAFTALLIFVTVRSVGLTEAGILSYAAAVSNLLIVLALFGVRVYQSTDIQEKYRFSAYLGLRTVTAGFASLSIFVFLVIRGFDLYMVSVILLYFIVFLADSYADVFMGDLQQKGKMRIAGRMRVCAFCAAFGAFVTAAFITRTLITPLLLTGVSAIIVYISWIWFYRNHFGKVRVKVDVSAIKNLISATLPLVLINLLFTFLHNAQKYYLEALDSFEAVAVYAILIQPIMLLSTFSSVFFMGAEMTKTAEIFAMEDMKLLTKRVNRQILLAVAMAAAFMLCAYLFGIPLMSWVYGIDLSFYTREFLLMALGGASTTVMSVLYACLVVMRKQVSVLVCLIIATAISGPVMWVLVSRYGISGAALSTLVIFVPLTVFCLVGYRLSIKKQSAAKA